MKVRRLVATSAFVVSLLILSLVLAQSKPEAAPSRSVMIPEGEMIWRRQTPELSTMMSELWGDRQSDGGAGTLLRLPPGFNSGLHTHSGDFHGVVIKGSMIHEGLNGEGRDNQLGPGSYVRQAGGELHVDRCVGEAPCEILVFQYVRADIVWPGAQKSDQ